MFCVPFQNYHFNVTLLLLQKSIFTKITEYLNFE